MKSSIQKFVDAVFNDLLKNITVGIIVQISLWCYLFYDNFNLKHILIHLAQPLKNIFTVRLHLIGLKLKAYKRPAGKWTIGYGHIVLSFLGFVSFVFFFISRQLILD